MESSGVVREAFRRLGHDAWSCDFQKADDGSPYHYQCDVRDVIGCGWDLLGFHPTCTYLCGSGTHWNNRGRGWAKTEQALKFVRWLMARPEPYYLENPVGLIGTRIRPADQTIQPYEFGEDASKRTCLWLQGLSKLIPTRRVTGRLVLHAGKAVERWANQTDSGQNRLTPDEHRWKNRSRTYPGIAEAMAAQWSGFLSFAQVNSRAATVAASRGVQLTWSITPTVEIAPRQDCRPAI